MNAANWFDVDRAGLAKIVEKRGKAFVIFELLQNALDERVERVDLRLEPIEHSPYAALTVTDDSPDGWLDLKHAWTLFASSYKKNDPEKRGRFNLGEKLVLSLCRLARITTTTGQVVFDEEGRHTTRNTRPRGSEFFAEIRMTRAEYAEVCEAIKDVIIPDSVIVTFNGARIPSRDPVFHFEETLPTEISDEDGIIRKSARKTTISAYEPSSKAMIYEMGIPIVEIDCRWSIDIGQKVPLTLDRDNVQPSFLKRVMTFVLNHGADRLSEDDAKEVWVEEAATGKDITPDALEQTLDLKYGEKRVMFDPSDMEANKIATSKGYLVVHGRTLPTELFDNIRRFRSEGLDVLPPAGKVTPSPKAYGSSGDLAEELDEGEWNDDVKTVVAYVKRVAAAAIGRSVRVRLMKVRNFQAAFCPGSVPEVHFSWLILGKPFFASAAAGDLLRLNSLLIHELGHHYSDDHLSSEYHDSLCDLGSKMTSLALERPELFRMAAAEKSAC